MSYEELFAAKPIHAVIDYEKCTACGNCARSCVYDAIEKGDDKRVITRSENCIGCELCYNVCPVEAISYAFTM
ncbi:MAG: ATP-binding protein [Desulfomonilaceae bacterium]